MLIFYGEGDFQLIGYSDASFQSYKGNCKSQAGFVFLLNGMWRRHFEEFQTRDYSQFHYGSRVYSIIECGKRGCLHQEVHY